MQKFILSLFSIAGLWLPVQTFADATNDAATNQVLSRVASTNPTQRPSDAELQVAARQVWHKLVAIGVIALVGAVGVVALGGLLLIF